MKESTDKARLVPRTTMSSENDKDIMPICKMAAAAFANHPKGTDLRSVPKAAAYAQDVLRKCGVDDDAEPTIPRDAKEADQTRIPDELRDIVSYARSLLRAAERWRKARSKASITESAWEVGVMRERIWLLESSPSVKRGIENLASLATNRQAENEEAKQRQRRAVMAYREAREKYPARSKTDIIKNTLHPAGFGAIRKLHNWLREIE